MGKIIVLVGQSGAGKTTVADGLDPEDGYLASCEILRAEVSDRGLEDTHENIYAVGMDLFERDPAWQGKRILKAAENTSFFVFDGPRCATDIEFLQRTADDVSVVGIYADRKIRYHRVIEREGGDTTKERFMARCVDEVIGAGLNSCLRMSNIYLFNNGMSLGDIQEYSRRFWRDLKEGHISKFNSYGISSDDDIRTFEKKLQEISMGATSSPIACSLMSSYLDTEEKCLQRYKRGEIPLEEFL